MTRIGTDLQCTTAHETEEPQPFTPLPMPRAAPNPGGELVSEHPDAGGACVEPPPDGHHQGGFSARSLQHGVSKQAVLEQVDSALSGIYVSEGDRRTAVQLLSSLAPDDFRAAFKELAREQKLGELLDDAPPDVRSQFLEAARASKVLTEEPARSASPRPVQPPDQPALLVNDKALPDAVRKAIHSENAARASGYTQRFDAYVQSYCAAVKQAQNPLELRALGDLSTPPGITEPGVDEKDRKLLGNLGLTSSFRGLEAAKKAVSNRISDFRGEIHAGGYSLGFEATAKMQIANVVQLGGTARTEISDDLRVIKEPEPKRKLSVGAFMPDAPMSADDALAPSSWDDKTKAKQKTSISADFDENGNVTGGQVTIKGIGVAHSKGRTTFGAEAGAFGVAQTFVDRDKSQYGAAFGTEASGSYLGGALKFSAGAKVTLTAQGIKREYYPDIGGTQEGVFGPMPELDAKTPWAKLPQDRRDWYARQGFDEKSWPHR